MKIILKLLFMLKLWLDVRNLNNAKHVKKISTTLMSVVWRPRRWWGWCMSKDDKKETEPF